MAGGITEVKRIATPAYALNVACFPHVWGTLIAMAAAPQLLATLPREVLLELDQSPDPIRDALIGDELTLYASARHRF